MKALQLGISYGKGVRSLAKSLQRHRLIASEVIARHKRQYCTSNKALLETAPTTIFDHFEPAR